MIVAIPPEAIGNTQYSAPIRPQIKIVCLENNGNLTTVLIEKIIRNQCFCPVKAGQNISIQINPNHLMRSQARDHNPHPTGLKKCYSKRLEVGITTQVWIKPSKTLHNIFEVAARLHSFGPDYEHFSPFTPEARRLPAAPQAKSNPPH